MKDNHDLCLLIRDKLIELFVKVNNGLQEPVYYCILQHVKSE